MKFKIGDLILILVALALTISGFIYIYFPKHYDSNYIAKVEFDNHVVLKVDFLNLSEEVIDDRVVITIDYDMLKHEKTYVLKGKISEVVICANKNGVYVKSSGCLDHICIDTGIINTPGRPIACIPNRVLITVIDIEADLS